MTTFTHATPQRCAQLGRTLTAASLTRSDNGRQDDPQFLDYTVTDPHGRTLADQPRHQLPDLPVQSGAHGP